jgi:manganese oxidase
MTTSNRIRLSAYPILAMVSIVAASACARAEAAPRVHEVRVLDDGGTLRFEPADIEVKTGDVVRYVYDATMPHNVEFVRNSAPAGAELGDAWSGPYMTKRGDTYELKIADGFRNGEYSYVCAPHVSMGMKGTLTVRGADDGVAVSRAADARPVITGVQGLQPLAYELDGTTKVFRLTAEKIRWETKEGTVVDAMAYNRMIPGPVIRVTEGDRVRVIVTNAMDEPHTTHWHGMFLPNAMDGVPGITQEPIAPGASFTYEFTADPHGTRLYHSHFNAVSQESKGLHGMFVIEERNAPAERRADREEIMLLSDGMGYTINGKEFPMTEPIRMKLGERVRVRIANLGAMYHPMHMHGGFMTVIAKDGFPLTAPQQINTISVAPGETYDVILAPQYAGTWLWHCHILSHATGPKDADGNDTAAGMIGAIVVEDGATVLVDLKNHTHH